MNAFVTLMLAVVASCAAFPQLPAGVDPAACPNYPFCSNDPLAIAASNVDHAAKARIAQQQFDLSQPILANVPGLGEHQAAEAQVLASQGRVPGSIAHSGNEARVLQAQADLVALQHQQAATTFTGLVGPSGVVGPSGLVGPAGPLAF